RARADRPTTAATDSVSGRDGDRRRGRMARAADGRLAARDPRDRGHLSPRLDARQHRRGTRARLHDYAAPRRPRANHRGARLVTHSETARQWVHVASAGFALLLPFLTWWQATALAATALAFNIAVLPRIGGRRLYRPVDEARGFPLGILL